LRSDLKFRFWRILLKKSVTADHQGMASLKSYAVWQSLLNDC
jgi:hypothetical protein